MQYEIVYLQEKGSFNLVGCRGLEEKLVITTY